MNAGDELLTLPPPPGCRKCASLEVRVTLGVERCRCVEGRPMHNNCGWFKARTPAVGGFENRGRQ